MEKGEQMVRLSHVRSVPEAGFSLIELLVVIGIICVLSAIAVMQLTTSNQRFIRQNAARDLKAAFERARFDSVKRRPTSTAAFAKVSLTSSSFTLTTDTNLNGTLETADENLRDLSGTGVVIAGSGGTALPYSVYFNQRGETVNSSGASIAPVFLVCGGSCSSPTSANANIVLVTPTGTVNLLPGDAAIPSFPAPNVSTVPASADVSKVVSIP